MIQGADPARLSRNCRGSVRLRVQAPPREFDAGAQANRADRLAERGVGALLPALQGGEPGQARRVRPPAQEVGLEALQLVQDGGGAPPRRRVPAPSGRRFPASPGAIARPPRWRRPPPFPPRRCPPSPSRRARSRSRRSASFRARHRPLPLSRPQPRPAFPTPVPCCLPRLPAPAFRAARPGRICRPSAAPDTGNRLRRLARRLRMPVRTRRFYRAQRGL